MNELNINEIVRVESIGVIKQQLDKVEKIIDDKTKNIPEVLKQLEKMTDNEKEEKKGEIKKYKAYLNSIKTQLEEKRKEIHNEIEKPYKDFNEYYTNGVKTKLEESIEKLNNAINDIERKQLSEKSNELKEFANRYINSYNLNDIIEYEDIPISVNLSSSMKSLEDKIIEFCERVFNDIKLIEQEEHKEEILLEYKHSLDFTYSKLKVLDRYAELETLKQKQEMKLEQEKQEEKIAKKVESALFKLNEETGKYEEIETITAPKEIIEDDEIIEVQFKVIATKEKILKLREFLKENEIEYE